VTVSNSDSLASSETGVNFRDKKLKEGTCLIQLDERNTGMYNLKKKW
jgi:hypothetical protein